MSDLIREKTITDIGVRVTGLLREYHQAINKVYEEDGEIKIAMPIKTKHERGTNKIQVGISFVTEKIDDTSSGYVEESQLSLFDDKGGRMIKCPLRPDDETFSSYCNAKCDKRKAVLVPDVIQHFSCSAWSDDDTRSSVEAHIGDYEERMKREVEAQKEPVKVYRMGAANA